MTGREVRSRLTLVRRQPGVTGAPDGFVSYVGGPGGLVSHIEGMGAPAEERPGTDPLLFGIDDDGPADLAEADGLITDLEALVDAGLVVVHPHVVGPARYGVARGTDDAA